MEIIQKEINSTPVISIIGEIDLYNSKELYEYLEEWIQKKIYTIILDVSQVPFMDSSAIGTLVNISHKLKKYSGSLKIINPKGSVAKVFKITNMEIHLSLHSSIENAFSSINTKI